MQNKPFSTNKTLNVGGRLTDLSQPKIMGILNVTPDSFYDGGNFLDERTILAQVEKMLNEGAAFIDVGGYSSRPGAEAISQEVETERVLKAVRHISRRFPEAIMSVDTFRSAVAEAAVQEGASMVNDISAGHLDARMFEVVGRLQVPYVAMHMRGDPGTMAGMTTYTNLVKEVLDYFHGVLHRLQEHNVRDVIIDPGFGFAKTREQNFELLHHLERFLVLGVPMVVGLSRKSMVWKTLGVKPQEALNGTTALHMAALIKGADILRVHDVKEAGEVIKLFNSMNASPSP